MDQDGPGGKNLYRLSRDGLRIDLLAETHTTHTHIQYNSYSTAPQGVYSVGANGGGAGLSLSTGGCLQR